MRNTSNHILHILLLLFLFFAPPARANGLGLTEAENNWLALHPTIRVSGPQSFPPFQFSDSNGSFAGIGPDHVLHLCQKIGITVQMQPPMPWTQVLEKTKNGDIDLLACAARTAEREQFLSFTEPYLSFPLVIITRKDADFFVASQHDLLGKTIALTDKVSSFDWLREDGISFTHYPTASPLEALQAVSLGRADAHIGNLAAMTYLIEKYGLANLKVAAPATYDNYTLSIAVRKDWPELTGILNKALAAMTPEEKSAIRSKWLSVRYEHGLRPVDLFKWVGLVGAIFLLCMIVTLLVNRRLKKEIRQREQAQKTLQTYKRIVAASRDLISFVDRAYIYKAVNDAYLEAHGKQRQEIVGRHVEELLGAEVFRVTVKKHLDDALHGKTVQYETWFDFAGTGKVFMAVSYFPYTDKKGQVAGVVVRSHDITEKKRSEEALAKSEEHYRLMMEQLPQAIVEVDLNGFLTFVNTHAASQFGYSKEDVKNGLNVLSLLAESDRQRGRENIESLLKGEKILGNEYSVLKKNGSIVPVILYSSPIFDKGRPVGLRSLIVDISEQKKREEQELRLQKLEAIGVLAGGIAHDFNNLLTAIMGNISLAKLNVAPTGEVYESLRDAEKASAKARELVRQLLTFAKGGAPVRQNASLVQIIKETVSFILHGSKVKCDYQFEEELSNAKVDAGQMSQVFQNLLINAGQAMPEGGTITICGANATIDAQSPLPLSPGKYVKISIADQGIGIKAEHLSKIFDPYFSTKQKGSGLGLATVHSIITKHDGHISVQSESGAGTVFHIYLPASAEKEQSAPAAKGVSMMKCRLLVMDDEEVILKIAQKMLEHVGCEVATAQDGKETIEKYRRAKERGEPFDAVIMDLTIPGGMGGGEAIKKLLEYDPHAKAIVSSGYSNDPIIANFRQYGFCAMVPKPYSIEELSDALQTLSLSL